MDTQEELKGVQKKVKELQTKIKEAHLRQDRLLGSSVRSEIDRLTVIYLDGGGRWEGEGAWISHPLSSVSPPFTSGSSHGNITKLWEDASVSTLEL